MADRALTPEEVTDPATDPKVLTADQLIYVFSRVLVDVNCRRERIDIAASTSHMHRLRDELARRLGSPSAPATHPPR